MEVSKEIKEDIRKTQNELKNAIRVHQAWVVRLEEDQNNVNIKRNIREAEKDIIAIGHTQKKVTERLRLELELYQQKLKARNKQINSDYDHRHIAQQLRDYEFQNRTRKKSISLLKPSVLSEINIKTENNNGNGANKSEDDYDEPMYVEQTNGVKIKEQLEDDEFIRATENFSLKDPAVHNTIQDSRAHFTSTLNKAKQRICPPVELITPMKRSPCASPKSGTPSPPRTERSPTLSPSPPPSLPSLPLPGEEVCQETFLRFLGLITPNHRQMLEKKRNERKKRSTTSTNKNDYVYGNFDLQTKKRKLNFPYLQQNIAPPTTRAQQRAKRQQEQQQLQQSQQAPSPRPSPPSLSSSSPPESPPPHPFLTLPNGLTIIPVVSPDPMPCCVCNQNDVPSLLRHCRGCGSYFHWSCATREGRSPPRKPPTAPDCPQCGETVKDSRQPSSMTVIGYANKPSEAVIKEKLSEKRLLQERNQQLRSDLKKLEMRAETLKENIESKNVVKKKLLSEQIETQKNLQKLLEFVGKFKDTPSYPVRRLVKEDSNCSDSN